MFPDRLICDTTVLYSATTIQGPHSRLLPLPIVTIALFQSTWYPRVLITSIYRDICSLISLVTRIFRYYVVPSQ